GPGVGGQSGAQDFTRFFFHRASVVGGANPQAGLGFLVQLPNGQSGHVSNDSIASIGCKETSQPATSSPLSLPAPLKYQNAKACATQRRFFGIKARPPANSYRN